MPEATGISPGLVLGLIIGYSIVVLVIGVFANLASRERSESEYFLAGRTFGLLVLFFTYCSTMFSFWYFTGSGGFWYRHGVGFYAHVPWTLFSSVMLYYFGVRMWLLAKRYDYVTPADMLAHRYESEAVRIVVAVVSIAFIFPYVLLQIKGAGIALEALTDKKISYEFGTTLMLVLVLVYTIIGGTRAVGWTDAAQGLVFFCVMWVVGIWMCVHWGGGLEGMFRRLADYSKAHLTLPGPKGAFTYPYWFSLWFISMIALTSPGLWLRIYAAKSAKTIRQTAALSVLALTLGYIPTMLYAFTAIPEFPKIANPDNLLMAFLARHWPGIGAVIIVGAFAAGMSTADSLLIATSAVTTRDLYKRYIDPKASQDRLMWVGRVFVAIFCLIVWGVAIAMKNRGGLLIMLGILSYGGCAQLVCPLVGALFWRGATKWGALVGTVAGVVSLIVLDNRLIVLFEKPPVTCAHPAFVALVINAVLFVVVSLFTRPESDKTHDEFFGFLQRCYARTATGSAS